MFTVAIATGLTQGIARAESSDPGNLSAAIGEKLPQYPLIIETAGGARHQLTVELALTADDRQHGLMFRKSMPSDHGMLFDFGSEARIAMWMKNTFIPLDMVFLDNRGVIRHIHENAIPHDETAIAAPMPIRYVLELNGGAARALGLKKGDRVDVKVLPRAPRR